MDDGRYKVSESLSILDAILTSLFGTTPPQNATSTKHWPDACSILVLKASILVVDGIEFLQSQQLIYCIWSINLCYISACVVYCIFHPGKHATKLGVEYVQWHVDNSCDSSGGCRFCRGVESLPVRSARFVNMNMTVHYAGHYQTFTHIHDLWYIIYTSSVKNL